MRVSDGERRVHGERAVQPATGFGVAARYHALKCQCRQCERTLGLDSQRVPECCDGGRILATEQQSRSVLMTCFGAARIEGDRSLEGLEDRVLVRRAAVTQVGNTEELTTRHPSVGRRWPECERSVGCPHRAGQERIARGDRGGPAPLEK